MGALHALHVHEHAKETASCVLTAVADLDTERAQRVSLDAGFDVPIFSSVEELAKAKICDAVVLVTSTDRHREHAVALIHSGHRVLLEKPLTGTLDGDRELAAQLDREAPNALMLAFQRRFDAPLQFAKDLLTSGAIGRLFKVYSALEDSAPAPDGYQSGGILPDMSVHNVDEILWLTGGIPRAALAVGSRLHSFRLTKCDEDFDDALLFVWFEDGIMGQVQVSRNHVSGYRVETILFGESGQIHIGRFEQSPLEVTVEAYGKRGQSEPIARRTFSMRDYGRPVPEFADRFGPAYKSEVAVFVECCRNGQPFPTSHRDGVRAQEIITAGMQTILTSAQAAPVPRASAMNV
jgi:predicted dehydrogenase